MGTLHQYENLIVTADLDDGQLICQAGHQMSQVKSCRSSEHEQS